MLKIGYSETFTTASAQYRYNYSTGQLEKIGKKITHINTKNGRFPVVETGVVKTYRISPIKFDKAPMFWVWLYEDAEKREFDHKI